MRRSLAALVLSLVVVFAGGAAALLREAPSSAPNEVVKLTEKVYFRHGDLKAPSGHCNNGFILFADFVLVIDANFPSGAEACLADLKKITDRPVRFVLDTHHHGDHAYGNPVWVKNGATPIAHEGVVREMARLEPGRWRESMNREDVKKTGIDVPVPPQVTFPERMVLDDGRMRVELFHLGVAHTRGDGFAYLPKEKILFTGDAVVNGPHNFMGDGNTESWVQVIAGLEDLDVEVVVPGHGPLGGKELLADQREYLEWLRQEVAAGVKAGKSADEIAAGMKAPEKIARYVGPMFKSQVAKVRSEMLGLEMPLELERLGIEPGPPLKDWKAPRKIVIFGEATDIPDFAAVAPGVRIVPAPRGEEEFLREVADADAVIGRADRKIIEAAKGLRWVHSPSAGVEKYLGTRDQVEPGIEKLGAAGDIVLTNARRCYGPNIADQAFAYLLSFTCGVKEAIEGREGPTPANGGGGGEGPLWERVGRGKRPAIELRGKTLLVVGVGGIGGQVAERAAGFGMRVIGIDPEPAAAARARFPVHQPGKLLELLPRADAVVVACPLTSASKGMFGKAEFAAMKDGAYFINVARGRIADPTALAEALRGGKLAGAGLDVTEPEPLPDASPLWDLKNVIITPHNAGQFDGSKRRGKLLTRENIRRFAVGEPLLNVVDKAKGY